MRDCYFFAITCTHISINFAIVKVIIKQKNTFDAITAVEVIRRLDERNAKDLLEEALYELDDFIFNTRLQYEILVTLEQFGVTDYAAEKRKLEGELERENQEHARQIWENLKNMRTRYVWR